MRVRILKSHVGLGRVLEVGEELDLSDTQAHQKIASGKAVRVVPPKSSDAAAPSSAPTEVPPAAPSRASLDAALAQLPGAYTDADYVVTGMRGHYGEVFTDADEAKVRELVKATLPPADETKTGEPAAADQTRTTEGAAETQDPPGGKKPRGKK